MTCRVLRAAADLVAGAALLPSAAAWASAGRCCCTATSVGFGVGSDLTYQAIAGVNWQFSKHISAKAGYRSLYQDFEKNGFV